MSQQLKVKPICPKCGQNLISARVKGQPGCKKCVNSQCHYYNLVLSPCWPSLKIANAVLSGLSGDITSNEYGGGF